MVLLASSCCGAKFEASVWIILDQFFANAGSYRTGRVTEFSLLGSSFAVKFSIFHCLPFVFFPHNPDNTLLCFLMRSTFKDCLTDVMLFSLLGTEFS